MKRWKKVALVIVGLMVLGAVGLGVGGMMIDPKIELGVSRHLTAPPAKLYPLLSSATGLEAWWSKAQESAPGMPKMAVKKKSGPDEGAGLLVTFEAGGQVMETWEIRTVEAPQRIVYAVDFAGMLTVERTLTLTPDGEGTTVSWQEKGSLDNPYFRWMKKVMPPEEVTKNFELALVALEKAATP